MQRCIHQMVDVRMLLSPQYSCCKSACRTVACGRGLGVAKKWESMMRTAGYLSKFAVNLAGLFSSCSLLAQADTPSTGASAAAQAASAAASNAQGIAASLSWVPSFTVMAVMVFFVAAVLLSLSSLKKDAGWKLGEALSEETDAPIPPAAPPNVPVPVPVPVVVPVVVPNPPPPVGTQRLAGSTSRLIAFLGMLGMLSIFMGLGLYLLWAFFNGKLADAENAVKAAGPYLLYGSALYAPYAFNQIKEAFKP